MDPKLHVEGILKKCFMAYPPNGKKHRKFFKKLVNQGSIPNKMASILTEIIEDPNCVYVVKADGTLKILK